MTNDICVQCRSILNGEASNDQQASRVDLLHPHCECEQYSVGVGSPGPVKSDEVIYRLVVSPGDIDPNTGKVLLEAIRDVKLDGLSVIRSVATDQEIEDLVKERLTIKPGGAVRVVEAILEIQVSALQAIVRENWGRLFCIYDETVPRKYSDLPPVPTHATLLQRVPPANAAGRKGQMKDDQKKLYDKLVGNRIDVVSFRNGLIEQLNQKSLNGDFVLNT